MATLMLISLVRMLALVSEVATLASIGYCLLALWAAVRFWAFGPTAQIKDATPGISVLKPLKGSDPELYEALRSHCLQDYPDYEILLGITEKSDPAAETVQKLMREFPDCRQRLVVCEKRLGANGKVSTLVQLAPMAAHDIVLVNDSDIRVASDYLRSVVSELQRPGTGMVTCLYRGAPSETLCSRLEALGISSDFVPGVLGAALIENGLHFGLGSTLAFHRRALEAAGGFEAVIDYLADDYELGHRIAQQGLEVRISTAVVETHLPAYDWRSFFSHQLRWARTIRASRPGAYAGLLLTFTLPWAIAAVVFSRVSLWALCLLVAALLMRIGVALTTARLVLRDQNTFHSCWLLPFRDLIGVVVWLGGMLGNTILWRGEKFTLQAGKLRRI